RYAIGFTVSLMLYLVTTVLLWLALVRVTNRPFLATAAAVVYALDPSLLREVSGIATTVPFVLTIAALTLFVAHAWPPTTPRSGALLGLALAGSHVVRIMDPPLLAAAATLIAIDRRWSVLAALIAAYVATSLALLPTLAVSSVAAASL